MRKELVFEWLYNYKFKTWTVTEKRKLPVTDEMKQKRASEIAGALTVRSRWRLHGRSIKAEDLEAIGLKITKVDKDPTLADVVYRIQTICSLLFDTTTAFKIFATQDDKIFRQAVPASGIIRIPPAKPALADAVELEQKCPKCGTVHKIYAKLYPNPQIDTDFKNRGFSPFPKDLRLKCGCGFESDLLGIKNRIEQDTKRKIILE